MKRILLLTGIIFLCTTTFAQNAKLTLKAGMNTKDLWQLLSFQNIHKATVTVKDSLLDGKFYQLFINEYKNGKFVRKDTLFDGTETDYFKVKGDSLAFDFFAQIDDNELKIQLMSTKFSSKKSRYVTNPNNREYVLKDFLGIKKELEVSLDKPFYIFAIITPTIHEDGSGSYCQVAQSDVDPEQFGVKFNIPHYFLIQMKFK